MGPSAPQPVVLQPEGEGAALGTAPPPAGSDTISREPESESDLGDAQPGSTEN